MAGLHIQAIQISCQLCSVMWILRVLGPIKFCKGPIKISYGPLKFRTLHVFEWEMGHWPILRAHHHFGLGLTLLNKHTCYSSLLSSGRYAILSSIFHLRKEKVSPFFSLTKTDRLMQYWSWFGIICCLCYLPMIFFV